MALVIRTRANLLDLLKFCAIKAGLLWRPTEKYVAWVKLYIMNSSFRANVGESMGENSPLVRIREMFSLFCKID